MATQPISGVVIPFPPTIIYYGSGQVLSDGAVSRLIHASLLHGALVALALLIAIPAPAGASVAA